MKQEGPEAKNKAKRGSRKSDRWGRTTLTAYLELTLFTLAGLLFLMLAKRFL